MLSSNTGRKSLAESPKYFTSLLPATAHEEPQRHTDEHKYLPGQCILKTERRKVFLQGPLVSNIKTEMWKYRGVHIQWQENIIFLNLGKEPSASQTLLWAC